MSFAINFGFNKSAKNVYNKNVTYPLSGQKTGTLKEDCDIVNPAIVISANASAFTNINYFEIPIFGRKYFITKIESLRTDLVVVYGHCDVLSSADGLLSNTCIAENLQVGFNRNLNDGSFKVYQNRAVINKFVFPNEFNTFEYVLALAGS